MSEKSLGKDCRMWIGCLVNKSHIIIGKKFLNIKIGSGFGGEAQYG